MSLARISRRRALILCGLGVSSIAAGATGCGVASSTPGSTLPPEETGASLREPAVLNSSGGRLEVELTAGIGVSLAGRDTGALGFNGISPGPTLRVRPGDELAVRLTNRLDQPTNLQTHGLRVSSQGSSDNAFLCINPGASFDYLFRIPPDHPAGTNWYHPHHHGTVADQLFGGLAGALLVDRGPDLPIAIDRLLLVTDTTLTDEGNVAAVDAMQRAMGRQGELVLVNGQHQPSIPATATPANAGGSSTAAPQGCYRFGWPTPTRPDRTRRHLPAGPRRTRPGHIGSRQPRRRMNSRGSGHGADIMNRNAAGIPPPGWTGWVWNARTSRWISRYDLLLAPRLMYGIAA
jgi:FtsP/CotA-like multicopper oxidase with cupredoxin domain